MPGGTERCGQTVTFVSIRRSPQTPSVVPIVDSPRFEVPRPSDPRLRMDAALIGVLGTLAGTVLGLAGAARLSQAQRLEQRLVEQRRVYARFLAATYSAVAELRELPPGSDGSTLAKLMDQFLGEDASYVRTRKELAAMGNTHVDRMDRLNSAIAEVQVTDLPCPVLTIVNETAEYVARLSSERTDVIKEEWPSVFNRLQEGSDHLNGSG